MHYEGRQALDTKSDGVQHLDGLQGLVFARTRHVAGENDLQRTGRTRRLLQALFHPIASRLASEYQMTYEYALQLSHPVAQVCRSSSSVKRAQTSFGVSPPSLYQNSVT